MNNEPLPWPSISDPSDRIDVALLPYAIATTVAELPPDVRVELIDRIGPHPDLTTDAMFHPEENEVSVMRGGEELLRLDLDLLAGVDLDVLEDYLEVMADGQPEPFPKVIRDHAEDLTIRYPAPGDPWIEVEFRQRPLGRVHRSRVVHRLRPQT